MEVQRAPRLLIAAVAILASIALLVVASPLAGASGPDRIEIEDPVGDVAVDLVPLGPGGAPYDLVSVALSLMATAQVALEIELAAAPTTHASAEFVGVFQVNGTWFMGGFTALPYPDSLPIYQGGFACPATADGFVNGTVSDDCIGIPDWEHDGTLYRVHIPMDFLNATHQSTYSDLWGYSEVTPYLKGTSRIDVTDRATERLAPGTPPPEPTADAGLDDANEAPSPVIVPLVIALSFYVVIRRRPREPIRSAETTYPQPI